MVRKIGSKAVLGLEENITLIGNNGKTKKLMARIDTGATRCSIDKSLVKEFDLGPELRKVYVKQAYGITKRPVIKVEIKIAGKKIKRIFTVADRSHLKYRMLIGHNMLKKGNFLIDPDKK